MRVSRSLAVVPCVLVLAGSLAACGGAASPSSEGSTPAHSQAATVEDAGFVLTSDNFADLTTAMTTASTYEIAGSVTVGSTAINLSGAYDGTDTVVSETFPGMADPVEIRLVGGVVYANMGELTGGLFWQVDPDDATNPIAATLGEATQQVSAADSLAELLPALVSVTKAGEPEQIDGVSAQAYDVVVDTSKLTGQAGQQLAAAAAQGVEIPTAITYSYWIGTDKLPRKLTMDLMGSTTEMTFSHWGGAIAVDAPTADQITTTAPSI